MKFPQRSDIRGTLPLLTVLVVSGSLLWWCGLRGWYPHDEGVLGQSALRLLRGEIPHRDFGDPYTGGLSLLHAGAFRLFGVRLDVLRRLFDVVAWGWSALVFLLARRWLPPWGAVLATICALVWSVPVYPAAMPSWYVLFLVTAALTVLVRDEGRLRATTLIVAGICLGLAVLVKVTALFAVAGICIAFGRLRQLSETRRPASLELLLGTGAFVLAAIVLTVPAGTSRVLVHVTLPTIVLAVAVLLEEVRTMRANGLGGDPALRRQVALLALGSVMPIAPFVIWLAVRGGFTPLLVSLGAAAGQRAEFARFSPPTAVSVLLAIPLLLALVGGTARVMRTPFLGALLGLVWFGAWQRGDVHRLVWQSVRGLLPLGAVVLAVLWVRRAAPVRTERPDHVLIALTCASLALGQFPFAAPIYYLYLAPLIVLTIVTMMPNAPQPRAHAVAVAAALAVFAAAQVLPGTPLNRGYLRRPAPALVVLPGAHGRLFVLEDEARVYRELLALIGRIDDTLPIWSGPDAPEVAFLAGRADRNSSFFAFLERSAPGALPLGDQLVREGVATVVIQTKPPFSPPLSKADLAGLARRYPEFRTVGTFEVRWRKALP